MRISTRYSKSSRRHRITPKFAEVILTFYIDTLISYLNEHNLASFQKATGISTSVRASEIDEIKQSPRWRVYLQSSLYKNLTDQCSAQFFTPFFIRPERGHGDFWLLHLSQHWKASPQISRIGKNVTEDRSC